MESREDRAARIPVMDEDAEMEVKGKYKDVADAAQAAFESAAYAAAAARAAVELSRSESGGSDHPHNSPRLQTRKASETVNVQTNEEKDVKDTEDGDVEGGFAEIQPAKTEDNKSAESLNENRKQPISVRTKPTHRW